jgi:hypothetical protein
LGSGKVPILGFCDLGDAPKSTTKAENFLTDGIPCTINFVIDEFTYLAFETGYNATAYIISLHFEPNRIIIFVIILYFFKL